ncbi:hypothetical protein SELMODRAFT_413527 [Selaginella moellendorffii]|uniref:Uncharacterized protein n=1 Tax=Selaginella moellendorffii TaxID=88036 RepID=D8RQJ9_SELML|nr:hypothetical protein SELMODRAFT_413527 [Selaginella moellendorffii]
MKLSSTRSRSLHEHWKSFMWQVVILVPLGSSPASLRSTKVYHAGMGLGSVMKQQERDGGDCCDALKWFQVGKFIAESLEPASIEYKAFASYQIAKTLVQLGETEDWKRLPQDLCSQQHCLNGSHGFICMLTLPKEPGILKAAWLLMICTEKEDWRLVKLHAARSHAEENATHAHQNPDRCEDGLYGQSLGGRDVPRRVYRPRNEGNTPGMNSRMVACFRKHSRDAKDQEAWTKYYVGRVGSTDGKVSDELSSPERATTPLLSYFAVCVYEAKTIHTDLRTSYALNSKQPKPPNSSRDMQQKRTYEKRPGMDIVVGPLPEMGCDLLGNQYEKIQEKQWQLHQAPSKAHKLLHGQDFGLLFPYTDSSVLYLPCELHPKSTFHIPLDDHSVHLAIVELDRNVHIPFTRKNSKPFKTPLRKSTPRKVEVASYILLQPMNKLFRQISDERHCIWDGSNIYLVISLVDMFIKYRSMINASTGWLNDIASEVFMRIAAPDALSFVAALVACMNLAMAVTVFGNGNGTSLLSSTSWLRQIHCFIGVPSALSCVVYQFSSNR